MWGRIVAAGLMVILPLTAGAGSRAPQPPPPRFVPVSSGVHVVAVWPDRSSSSTAPKLAAVNAPAGDTTLLSKTVDAGPVAPGGTLNYTVTVTNATNVTQTFHVTDTLPASLSFITDTTPAAFDFNPGTASLTAAPTLNAFHGDIITVTGAPTYTELASPTNSSICLFFSDCDNNAITLAGVSFQYLGVRYTTITLDSNGFVIPGSVRPGLGNLNHDLPLTTMTNTVIAPFWTDLDLNGSSPFDLGGGDWYYGIEEDTGNNNAEYLVVEWSHAQRKSEPSTDYSFEVWIQLNAEHITFAYGGLTGDTNTTTIGFENSDGTLGYSYLYNDSVPIPEGKVVLQIVANFDTALLGYAVQAQPDLHGCSTIINTAQLSNEAGDQTASAAATTTVFGPCIFLPTVRR